MCHCFPVKKYSIFLLLILGICRKKNLIYRPSTIIVSLLISTNDIDVHYSVMLFKTSLIWIILSFSQPVSLQEAKLLLKEDDELIKEVYEYWSKKRKACQISSLIPVVKQEKRDGSSTSDSYVAFRRRTEKMQTRKVRGQCSMNWLRLWNDMRINSRIILLHRIVRTTKLLMRRCWNCVGTWAEPSQSWRWSRDERRANESCCTSHWRL